MYGAQARYHYRDIRKRNASAPSSGFVTYANLKSPLLAVFWKDCNDIIWISMGTYVGMAVRKVESLVTSQSLAKWNSSNTTNNFQIREDGAAPASTRVSTHHWNGLPMQRLIKIRLEMSENGPSI